MVVIVNPAHSRSSSLVGFRPISVPWTTLQCGFMHFSRGMIRDSSLSHPIHHTSTLTQQQQQQERVFRQDETFDPGLDDFPTYNFNITSCLSGCSRNLMHYMQVLLIAIQYRKCNNQFTDEGWCVVWRLRLCLSRSSWGRWCTRRLPRSPADWRCVRSTWKHWPACRHSSYIHN